MAFENYQKSLANSMMESGKKQRGKYSCGNCQGCSLSKPDDDCGTCRFCLDKTKFGGNNKLRQKCILKKCQYDDRKMWSNDNTGIVNANANAPNAAPKMENNNPEFSKPEPIPKRGRKSKTIDMPGNNAPLINSSTNYNTPMATPNNNIQTQSA